MNPTLKIHLSDCHALAVRTQAVAEALELMMGNGLADHRATSELSTALTGMVIDLQRGLDVVNLPAGEGA